ncbi:Protein of unknown function [Pyronema omphalodes CBS 100304]|uniref:Uncharacterized protein n=1 Tax=Pyronema omphalodes (strain CBS 100304) TaxID=1076935 RepID=U4LQ31_PYROM|nr:Protein of unknown function [Pyronema omphalodes CBS 100304]
MDLKRHPRRIPYGISNIY